MRAWIVAALLLSPAITSAQADRDALVSSSRARAVEGARVQFAHAVALMRDGHFEEACGWLDRALLVVDSPAIRWNLAACRNETDEPALVEEHLRAFLRSAPLDHPHMSEALAWLQRLAPAGPEGVPEATEPAPEPSARPAPLPPLHVPRSAFLDLPPEPTPRTPAADPWSEPWAWLGVIGGAAVLVAAAIVVGVVVATSQQEPETNLRPWAGER